MLDNQKLPDFTLPRDGGSTVSLSDFAGKKLVLFLYPKDDTQGCTVESIAFSKAQSEFAAAGAEILGLSKDSVASHDKFVAKHDLTVPLISDESGALIEALGAWIEKNNFGKKYMGIDRSTFLIDGDGIIRKSWRKVKVSGHVEEVLKAVKSL